MEVWSYILIGGVNPFYMLGYSRAFQLHPNHFLQYLSKCFHTSDTEDQVCCVLSKMWQASGDEQ